MSTMTPIMALAGLYLLSGLIISSYRQAQGKSGGQGLWILLWAVYTVLMLGGATDGSAAWAVGGALLWLAGTLGTIRLGNRLRGRAWPGRMVWLLGPVHALGLASTYLRDVRREVAAEVATEVAGRVAGKVAGKDEDGADLDEPTQEAFESVVELGETTLEEVMVPRSELAYLESEQTVRDWLDILRRRGHRVIPVCGEDLDEILGCVHLTDLYVERSLEQPVEELLHDVRFVPETMRCDDLLREMIARGESLAIVVDEFGGTAGVVSDHDLFEILLGEINRQNPLDGRIIATGDGEYVADGHYRIDDFNDDAHTPLPEGDYETVAGLMLDRFGKVPTEGEKLARDGFELEVLQGTERRIERIRIRVPVPEPLAEENGRRGVRGAGGNGRRRAIGEPVGTGGRGGNDGHR